MKLLSTATILLLSSSTISLAQTYKVPASAWVEVKNLKPISNSNGTFSFGDQCSINISGTITKIKSNKDEALIEYNTDKDDKDVSGVLCPNGTQFLMSIESFNKLPSLIKAVEEQNKNDRETISKLLNSK